MTLKGCFRKLEVKVGSCVQCTHYEHDSLTGIHICNNGVGEISLHNVMYIVPKDCPLPNYYEDVKAVQIDPEDEVCKLLWDMEEIE